MDEHSRRQRERERENGRGGKASQNKSVQRNELTLLMFLSATKDRIEKEIMRWFVSTRHVMIDRKAIYFSSRRIGRRKRKRLRK